MTEVQKNADIDRSVAMVGNPNVGKSVIFNQLTGLGVQTANYQGTTVKVNEGLTYFKGKTIKLVDLPGAYGLSGISEDQRVTRRSILEHKHDCLLVITDATNLQRNLFLALQLIDMGLPVVVCLNLTDVAESKGLKTDISSLSERLGVPVVETVATQGKGLDKLIEASLEVRPAKRPYAYGQDFEREIALLTKELESEDVPFGLSAEAYAFLLAEEDPVFQAKAAGLKNGKAVIETLMKVEEAIDKSHHQSLSLRLATERHGLAGNIVSDVQMQAQVTERISDRLWRLSTHPVAGLIALIAFITLFFGTIVYAGIFLSKIFETVWSGVFSPAIQAAVHFVLGQGSIAKIILWGLDDGISAALSIGVAFILPFYLLLAVLEDSGYLNSLAFLLDRVAHRLGLHGRSFIPLISAAGCNVPAIMGTRALGNERERFIASTLITMIPCSARTAVILGSVALFAGIDKAIIIYLIVLIIVFTTGFALNKILPGKSTGLVMEIFPFRFPSLKTTITKVWLHLKGFVGHAFPLIVGGSLIMGILFEIQINGQSLLELVSKPLSFLTVSLLGLPAVTGVVLFAGFLRKEMALELLFVLAAAIYGTGTRLPDFMTDQQLFIFALVVSLYIPCLATFTVLGRELGWWRASAIGIFTVVLAFAVGGLFNLGFSVI